MTTRAFFALILCNVVWSANPTAGKLIIQEVGPGSAAWLRYASSFVFYLVMVRTLRRGPWFGSVWIRARSPRDWGLVSIIGLSTCFLSPLTQMLGLSESTAMSNAILVSFEPIFTVLLGWVFLRERLRRSHGLSFLLAILGFSLLSGFPGPENGASESVTAWRGNLLLLIAVACESLYSVVARPLLSRHSGTAIFGSAMAVGCLALSILVGAREGIPQLGALSWKGWLGVLWFGPIGTAIPYLIWLRVLKGPVPLGSMVLTLFLQPFVGSLIGAWFLGEALHASQLVGGTLILLAVIFQVLADIQAAARARVTPEVMPDSSGISST